MFGDNPIRKQEDTELLRVQEIFYTIQGEGPFSGCPAIFIRLAGCNLACTFCDTDFESNWENQMKFHEIADKVIALGHGNCDLVVLTGGEPFRQNITRLCNDLIERNFHVQIETAGTLWNDGVFWQLMRDPNVEKLGVSIVVSPKTPKVHHHIKQNAVAWKYIIRAGETLDEDGLPNKSTQIAGTDALLARPPLFVPKHRIFLQPCEEHGEGAAERNKANRDAAVASCLKHGYRLSLQTHKIVGLP